MWGGVVLLLAVVGGIGYVAYQRVYRPNVEVADPNRNFLLVPTGSTFEDVIRLLHDKHALKDEASFRWTAARMKYGADIKPGRYRLRSGMSNRELVQLLRSGQQSPVKLVFNNIRTKAELAERIGQQLEVKPEALLHLLGDNDYLAPLGFNASNILAMFLPDTYEIYWNTSADQFMQRMKREYGKFWNKTRLQKAKRVGLDPVEVAVLASIVQQESNREDEKPVIAGVYLNRLRKGMKLEADPTLVYALGDFTINRVLNIHKEIDSPYNTYLYAGLPPGPICLPTGASIDAVLNYQAHNYYYFCARDDFSGYHAFASTYQQHLVNARRFQKALDRRGIRS
jgi:UPF0755 protein